MHSKPSDKSSSRNASDSMRGATRNEERALLATISAILWREDTGEGDDDRVAVAVHRAALILEEIDSLYIASETPRSDELGKTTADMVRGLIVGDQP